MTRETLTDPWTCLTCGCTWAGPVPRQYREYVRGEFLRQHRGHLHTLINPEIKTFHRQFNECMKAKLVLQVNEVGPLRCARFGGICHAKNPQCQELRSISTRESAVNDAQTTQDRPGRRVGDLRNE